MSQRHRLAVTQIYARQALYANMLPSILARSKFRSSGHSAVCTIVRGIPHFKMLRTDGVFRFEFTRM